MREGKDEKNEVTTDIIEKTPTPPSEDRRLPSTPTTPPWKLDFNVYSHDLGWAYKQLRESELCISQKEKFYPDVDVAKTLEKIIFDFWATKRRWECKKKQSNDKLDWRLTFDRQISHSYNQVLKQKTNENKQSHVVSY